MKYVALAGLELVKLSNLASNSYLPASKMVLVLKCSVPFLALINLLNT